MPFVTVRVKVRDYSTWRKAFDEGEDMRTQHGITGGCIARSISDPNDLLLYIEAKDIENVRELCHSPEMKEHMKKAGVIGDPEVLYLEEVDKFGLLAREEVVRGTA